MFETKIKNNVTLLEDIPSNKWGPMEFEKWQANTAELINQCTRMFQKLAIIAQNWNYK